MAPLTADDRVLIRNVRTENLFNTKSNYWKQNSLLWSGINGLWTTAAADWCNRRLYPLNRQRSKRYSIRRRRLHPDMNILSCHWKHYLWDFFHYFLFLRPLFQMDMSAQAWLRTMLITCWNKQWRWSALSLPHAGYAWCQPRLVASSPLSTVFIWR